MRGKRRLQRGGVGAAAARSAAIDAAAVFEAEVREIGARGDGVAASAAGPLYIPFTAPGDRVRARPIAAATNGFSCELVEILSPSPMRAQPPCPHFGRCGGCSLQHLSDAAYVGAKAALLAGILGRARLSPGTLTPLQRTPPNARRRARFAVLRPTAATSSVRIGFQARKQHDIVDLAMCPVLDPSIPALLPALRDLLADILDPGQRGGVRITVLAGGLDVVVEWPHPPGLAARERLAAFAERADLARLSWCPASGTAAEPLAQRRPLAAVFGGMRVVIPPGGFVQASAAGEAALVGAVCGAVGQAHAIADLFAGAGTFTIPLAAAGANVLAVDSDDDALRALALAARTMPRVRCERRDLLARPLLAEELCRFDAVVFDPPRAGAHAQAVQLARSAVPVITAVSCNPASFARDAQILVGGGYRIESIMPVDQFLWSPHLELAAVFRR